VNRPKGFIDGEDNQWTVLANDQALGAAEYLPIIVSYRNGAPMRLIASGQARGNRCEHQNTLESFSEHEDADIHERDR
jgi:multidrug efflux pump